MDRKTVLEENAKFPPLPDISPKPRSRRNIDGSTTEYSVVDYDVFYATSHSGKAFAIHKLETKSGREEFRIGYYMIGHKPGRMKGKWVWAQYAPMMSRDEMALVFERVKKKGWI